MPAISGPPPLPEAFRGHGPPLRRISINQLNPPLAGWLGWISRSRGSRQAFDFLPQFVKL